MTRTQERKPKQSLADLKTGAQITCYYGHPAPAAGAVKFHGLHVCAACAAKLKAQAQALPARKV